MSTVGWRRDNVWSNGHGGSKPCGRSFKELPQDIGQSLCGLIDEESGMDENQNLCGLQDEECEVDPMHMTPSMYPSMFYPERQENLFTNRGFANADTGGDKSLLLNGWEMPAERCVYPNVLTDDDILEMTYEEYLEAHGRHQLVNESSRKSQESSISKKHDDDFYSRFHSMKRSHHYLRHHSPKRE